MKKERWSRGLPRYDLPMPVCPGWGDKSRSLPLMLLSCLHGFIHIQPEYYANWTRCLQSMSPSPSLWYCSHDRSSSCWLYIQLWWYSSPPTPSSSLPQHQPVQNTGQSADFIFWFQLIIHPVPFISPSAVFSLLSRCTVLFPLLLLQCSIHLFAKQLLPVSKHWVCNVLLPAPPIILLFLWTVPICAYINIFLRARVCAHVCHLQHCNHGFNNTRV